ncbi:MAG: peptidoglycan recognition family protein [Actinomycetota bacterium]|nr:peptidoglycan recognition family protein [Actinomycetota bacterium]
MTGASIGRRRFLAAIGAALGATAVGVIAAGTRSSGGDTSAVVTTATSPQAATTSTATVPSTTALPATTSPPGKIIPATTTPATTTSPSRSAIPVICRDAWGAQPVTGDFTKHTIDRIMVHHTAVVLAANGEAPGRARQHQDYHQGLGWPDLAYHYLIDANGNVYEGRPLDAVGDTATEYDPTGYLLVCCEGDFNKQEIGVAQVAALVDMLAWGAAEFGVDPVAIRGHRDVASTTCPGDHLYRLLEDGSLIAAVSAAIDAGAPALSLLCGEEAVALVAAIEAGSA